MTDDAKNLLRECLQYLYESAPAEVYDRITAHLAAPAPEPVEPEHIRDKRSLVKLHGLGGSDALTIQYIDSLQSALKLAQEELRTDWYLQAKRSDEMAKAWEREARELKERAEKAESINRRMVELLKEIRESACNAASRDISQVGVSEINQGALLRIQNMSAELLKEVK